MLPLRKLNVSLKTAFSFFFSLFCPALVVGWERFGMALMPQPHRYRLEFDLSLCLLGISLLPSILRFAKPNKLFLWLFLPLAIFLVIQTRHVQRIARNSNGPIVVTATVEYKVSAWFRVHLGDRRVFRTGSTQFWRNASAWATRDCPPYLVSWLFREWLVGTGG